MPARGEVLALVSYPYFDPNLFLNDNGNELYAKLLHDTRNPLLNRAVNASYPPASTFKIVMSTAILAEKAFPPDKKVLCAGEVDYGERIFRCHIRRPGHGYLDLRNALAQSCDIYYWTVCRDNLGIDKMAEIVRGLIGTVRGDDTVTYFEMLSRDLDQLELQRLNDIASMQPRKVGKYQLIVLAVMIANYVVIMILYVMGLDRPF